MNNEHQTPNIQQMNNEHQTLNIQQMNNRYNEYLSMNNRYNEYLSMNNRYNKINVIYIDINISRIYPYILGLKNFYKVKIYVIFDKKFSLFSSYTGYKNPNEKAL
ncbi:hypothetical protein D3C87_1037400 [compost metagenome]